MSKFYYCVFLLIVFNLKQFECQTCPLANYVATDCYNACSERTCANWRRGPVACTRDCQAGPRCVCGGNMYKNDCHECVAVQQCNSTCTCTIPNSVSNNNCYNACSERTCANLKRDQENGPTACTLECQVNGPQCECREGFYRNNENNQCVTAEQCNVTITTTPTPTTPTSVSSTPPVTSPPVTKPPACPLPNFEPTTCYNACSERTCANLRKEKSGPVICTQDCQAGGPNGNCVCANGLYRNDCNVCVPKEHCNVKDPTATCKCNKPFEEIKHVSHRAGCQLPSYCNRWKSCRGRSHKRRHCNGTSCGRSRKCRIPKSCRCREENQYQQVCSCQRGYTRNRCGACVPPHVIFIGPCSRTDYEY